MWDDLAFSNLAGNSSQPYVFGTEGKAFSCTQRFTQHPYATIK